MLLLMGGTRCDVEHRVLPSGGGSPRPLAAPACLQPACTSIPSSSSWSRSPGSRGPWKRPLHVFILQRLACKSAPRHTMAAPSRAVRLPLVSGRTLRGMWRCGPYPSQGAEVGQCAANLYARPLVALEVFRRGHVSSLGATMARPMIAAAGADDASDAMRRPLSLALIAAATRVGALAARRQAQTRTWRVISVQAKPWIGPWMQSLRPALAPRDIRHWTQERTE
jgi:hypothetical protein